MLKRTKEQEEYDNLTFTRAINQTEMNEIKRIMSVIRRPNTFFCDIRTAYVPSNFGYCRFVCKFKTGLSDCHFETKTRTKGIDVKKIRKLRVKKPSQILLNAIKAHEKIWSEL